MISAAATGFFTAFSLILAIGAQNAFVLRQGILRQHIFALCLICALSDGLLIAAGVGGFGYVVTLWPVLPTVMALAGAAFLAVYGAMRFFAAWRGDVMAKTEVQAPTLRGTIIVGLALTWLNPHVYLDTLGLIGAVSTRYPSIAEKVVFALAAITSSFTFFFSLGYGARYLAPLMRSSRAWQVFDLLIGLTMWMIAAGLIRSVV